MNTMLSPGHVLQERYDIEEMLGKGGFGAVYRARDRRLKRQVAIKETLHLEPDILRLFEREAEVLASLEHPMLPAVIDYFSEENTYYTVMSFIPGQDLGDYLDQQPQHRMDEQRTLEIILPVLEALEYLHTRTPPIVHRDIKPGNIRLTPEGKIYLVDFGLAKQFDAKPVSTLSVVALTPSFSPPEQYYQQADTRSDIYALGATMYVMLGGTNPIPAHERMSGKELVPIRQHNPDVSNDTEALITRTLDVRPDERYQSATELRQAVQALLAQLHGEGAPTTPDSQTAVAPSDAQANVATRAAPDTQADVATHAAPDASGQKPDFGAWLSWLHITLQRLLQSPPVQNIAAKLPLPAQATPWSSQIVVGGGALLGIALLVGIVLLLVAVSSGGEADTIAMSDETQAKVSESTIKIEAEGSFAYPNDTWRSWIGQGSGVILDDTGIALTSHHVVAGAGTLQVQVGNEEEPYIARLLGSSECLDLAVIDIEGEGFATLNWYDGKIEPGLTIFAAGFPGGEEITLSRGLVTDPEVSGETSWASLNTVIEHDAEINPGSSGGPLVTVQGNMLGINYRSRPTRNGDRHSHALDRNDILDVIEQLRRGENVLSIGVNGEVVQGEQVSGIWVYSIESGSRADQSRVRPGDIITHLEGVSLGDEGTLTKYCRVLRSHSPDDVLSLRVMRAATGEVFEGQLNGRELELMHTPAQPGPVAINDPQPIVPTEATEEDTAQDTAVGQSETATPPASAQNDPPSNTDAAADTDVVPITSLSDDELKTRQQEFQDRLERYDQVLDETFDSRATRSRWLRDNNTTSLRHRLIHDYYELTLKEPGSTLVDPWNHQRLGDTYIVEIDIAFEESDGMGAGGILFDMQDNGTLSQFLVSNNGTWQLHTLEDGDTVRSRSASFSSDAIDPANVNNLRVVRMPNEVVLWINDIPVGTAPVEETSGMRYYTGITGASGDEDETITVLIDNLFVWH
jgi:serine/threonine protein kinase